MCVATTVVDMRQIIVPVSMGSPHPNLTPLVPLGSFALKTNALTSDALTQVAWETDFSLHNDVENPLGSYEFVFCYRVASSG